MRNRSQLCNAFTLTSVVAVAAVLLVSCSSIGPRTLERDQMDYSRGVGDSWKNQMLSNLVKLRFIDMPVFVDVGQIVSGYSLETTLSGTLGFDTGLGGIDSQSLSGGGRYTDRPTITYVPKTGEKFLRSLLEPVDPTVLLSLVLTGYNPELLFTWSVESINGVHNHPIGAESEITADPEFFEFLRLLTQLQSRGAVGFEIRKLPESGAELLFRFVNVEASAEIRDMQQRLLAILRLNPAVDQYRIVYSPFLVGGDMLAIQTRSVLQMMLAMSRFVDVPTDKANRATPALELSAGTRVPFRIHVGRDEPEDAYAAYRYHDDWYWIDHQDLASKRVFTLMLFITTLTNYSSDGNAPVLTIPTG